jgi:hypothetical protein
MLQPPHHPSTGRDSYTESEDGIIKDTSRKSSTSSAHFVVCARSGVLITPKMASWNPRSAPLRRTTLSTRCIANREEEERERVYVGQTKHSAFHRCKNRVCASIRWRLYRSEGDGYPLARAMAKFGWQNFATFPLEVVPGSYPFTHASTPLLQLVSDPLDCYSDRLECY